MERLEYRFLWNAGEHRRFYRALQRTARRGSKARLALNIWLGFLATVSILAMIGAWRSGNSVLPMTPPLACVIVWLVFDRWFLARSATRAYARHHAACIPNDQVRVLTPEGISAVCTTSSASVSWEGICRVEETPEFFLFLTTPVCAIQLPKRAVGDVDRLRTWLREVLGRAAATTLRLGDAG